MSGYNPNAASHKTKLGKAVRRMLARKGMTIASLARRLKTHNASIHMCLAGKAFKTSASQLRDRLELFAKTGRIVLL